MVETLDKAGLLYVISKIKTLLGEKVDLVDGKGLSSNDFTAEYKTKLDGIAVGATKNIIDSALNDTSTNAVQNKVVSVELSAKAPTASPTLTGTPKAPTANVGTNNTQIATTEFVTRAVANAIGTVTSIEFSVVSSLPASGRTGTIYLVSNNHGTNNVYDEYIWVGSKWEKIGETGVDLSGYVKTSDLTAITNTEIDAMFT